MAGIGAGVSLLAAGRGMCTILAGFRAGVLLHFTVRVIVTMTGIGLGTLTMAAFRSTGLTGTASSCLAFGHRRGRGCISCGPGRLCIGSTSATSLASFGISFTGARTRLFHFGGLVLVRSGFGGLGIDRSDQAGEREEGEELFHVGMVGVGSSN